MKKKLERADLFHSPGELTKKAELIDDEPSFVEIPTEGKTSGNILLQLNIDQFGTINSLSILRSSLPHQIEEQVALKFYRAKYRPGEIDGIPVNSEMYVFIQIED